MRRQLLVWLLTAALLACAWVVSKATLPDDATIAPFSTAAQLGEEAVARNLVVTVTDVRLARTVSDSEGWSAEGTWLIVDLEAATAATQDSGLLAFAQLTVGERAFSATERGTTFFRQRLITGVPRSGSLAFELPEGIGQDPAAATASLRFAVGGEALSDGVIDLPIDLTALPVEDEGDLQASGWARP